MRSNKLCKSGEIIQVVIRNRVDYLPVNFLVVVHGDIAKTNGFSKTFSQFSGNYAFFCQDGKSLSHGGRCGMFKVANQM